MAAEMALLDHTKEIRGKTKQLFVAHQKPRQQYQQIQYRDKLKPFNSKQKLIFTG